MLLYSVIDNDEKNIVNVAFKFLMKKNFMQALIRTIEGSSADMSRQKAGGDSWLT